MRFLRALVAIIVSAASALFVPASEVSAGHYTYCYPETNYAFAAQKRTRSAGIRGISAELEAQNLYPCALPPGATRGNATWVWVALEGGCGGSGNCIIQIGIGKGTKDERMGWWWAWGRHKSAPGCGSKATRSPSAMRFADWNAAQSKFQIVYVSASDGPDYWSLRIDGVQKKKVYAPDICWSVTSADWFGESPNRASAVGGTLGNPFLVYAARYRIPGDGTWYTPSWTDGQDCDIENPRPPFRCRRVAHDSLHIWTMNR